METPYNPKFLSWAECYEHEVLEMEELIESNPSDVKELKKEYEQLTGKKYYSKQESISKVDESESKEQECRNRNHPNNNYSRKLKDY